MNRAPPHIPLVSACKCPLPRPMHDAGVIPNHQIPWLLPLDTTHILILRRMRQQVLNQLRAFLLIHSISITVLQMMQMIRNIQIPPPAPLMHLHNPMSAKRILFHIDVFHVRTSRHSLHPTMPQTMRTDIILLQQRLLHLPIELLKRGPCIRKLRIAPRPRRRQLMRSEQRKPRAPRVEAAVDVEQSVAAARVIPSTARLDDTPVVFLVADVEELVVGEAVLAAERQVRFHVVQVAEESREGHVRFVCEGGVAEDEHPVGLDCGQDLGENGWGERVVDVYAADGGGEGGVQGGYCDVLVGGCVRHGVVVQTDSRFLFSG